MTYLMWYQDQLIWFQDHLSMVQRLLWLSKGLWFDDRSKKELDVLKGTMVLRSLINSESLEKKGDKWLINASSRRERWEETHKLLNFHVKKSEDGALFISYLTNALLLRDWLEIELTRGRHAYACVQRRLVNAKRWWRVQNTYMAMTCTKRKLQKKKN
jgi:hypothetical protein